MSSWTWMWLRTCTQKIRSIIISPYFLQLKAWFQKTTNHFGKPFNLRRSTKYGSLKLCRYWKCSLFLQICHYGLSNEVCHTFMALIKMKIWRPRPLETARKMHRAKTFSSSFASIRCKKGACPVLGSISVSTALGLKHHSWIHQPFQSRIMLSARASDSFSSHIVLLRNLDQQAH